MEKQTSVFSRLKTEWMSVSSKSRSKNFFLLSTFKFILLLGSGNVTDFFRINYSDGPFKLLTE